MTADQYPCHLPGPEEGNWHCAVEPSLRFSPDTYRGPAFPRTATMRRSGMPRVRLRTSPAPDRRIAGNLAGLETVSNSSRTLKNPSVGSCLELRFVHVEPIDGAHHRVDELGLVVFFVVRLISYRTPAGSQTLLVLAMLPSVSHRSPCGRGVQD